MFKRYFKAHDLASTGANRCLGTLGTLTDLSSPPQRPLNVAILSDRLTTYSKRPWPRP